jgi:hypothetical protein
MPRIRRHLSFANVASAIALFVALGGGTAVALSGSNTVFTDDIANDTQPASGGNPAGGLVAADLRPNSVGTSEVINRSLTGGDLANSSIGAAKLASGLRELVPVAVVLIASNGSVAEEAHRAPITGPPNYLHVHDSGNYLLGFPGLSLGGNDLALCTYRGNGPGGGEIRAVPNPSTGNLAVHLRSSSGGATDDSFQCAVYDL